jgi:hypothetical protein
VILVYPALLVLAALIARRSLRSRRGPGWFAAWAVAGMLFAFSLATGFSIGLFLLPVAAVVLFWVASRAPRWREASGFLVGVAGIAALLVALNA